MENASKALLIAGAVLIVILIIGVGMMIFSSSKGSFDEAVAQMSSQEIEMFNNQFTVYAGERVNGSSVKALLSKVDANNAINDENSGKHIDTPNRPAQILTAVTYHVTCTPDATGLIHTITIQQNNATT